MRNDTEGAVNPLMLVLLLAIVVLVAGWYFGILYAIIGTVMMAAGFLALVNIFPAIPKGMWSWLIGLVLIVVGFVILM